MPDIFDDSIEMKLEKEAAAAWEEYWLAAQDQIATGFPRRAGFLAGYLAAARKYLEEKT